MPTFDSQGTSLYYEDQGNGDEVVVVIHGAAASAAAVAENVSALSSTFRVLAPDLRGMGRSAPSRTVSPRAWVDDVEALLDFHSIESAHIAGTSLGARIALRCAVELGSRARSVGADSPILADTPEGSAAVRALFGPEMPDHMAQNLKSWHGAGWRDAADRYLALRQSEGLQESYDLRERLRDIACPVFVARGDVDDRLHPLSHAVAAHGLIPNSHLWIAPNTPFSTMRFRPADWARQFAAFAADVARALAETRS